MRLTQGTFSYLPDLSDEQIEAQIQYCLDNDWPIAIEYTDNPHPRNVYWDMWGMPMFDMKDPKAIMIELEDCRNTYPNQYIRIIGYDRSYGRQTTGLSFIVNRPKEEPGFRLDMTESHDRVLRYRVHPYAVDRPSGERYNSE